MPTKTKITLTNSLKYQFTQFLRIYQQALTTTCSPELLQPIHILNVLDFMGFVASEKTEKDYELINTIAYLLSFPRKQASVSPRNLFKFLVTLTDMMGQIDAYFQQNAQPLPKDHQQLEQPLITIFLGQFDSFGRWEICQEETLKLKQIFGHMVFTRASRVHNNLIKKPVHQDQIKSNPKILRKSIVLAQQRNQRLGTGGPVEQRLIQSKMVYQSRIQKQSQSQQQKQLQECSFKPKINSFAFRFNNQNEQYHNRDELLLRKGREYDLRRKMHQMQKEENHQKMNKSCCSFQPDLSLSRASLRQSVKRDSVVKVKNEEKMVNRLRIASQQRFHLNEVHKRGYPSGVSWMNYMEEVRDKRVGRHSKSVNQSLPSISFDLKNISQSYSIQFRDVEKINESSQISSSHTAPILKLLKSSQNKYHSLHIRDRMSIHL